MSQFLENDSDLSDWQCLDIFVPKQLTSGYFTRYPLIDYSENKVWKDTREILWPTSISESKNAKIFYFQDTTKDNVQNDNLLPYKNTSMDKRYFNHVYNLCYMFFHYHAIGCKSKYID